MKGPQWLKIGYDVTASRILTRVLKIGKIVVQTPSTSPFHPKYYFEGHRNGQKYVKNCELLCYWLYIRVVWGIFRIWWLFLVLWLESY